MATKKVVASATKKAAPPPPPVNESMMLYTIRIAPSLVDKLHERARKLGVSHAEVARTILGQFLKGT